MLSLPSASSCSTIAETKDLVILPIWNRFPVTTLEELVNLVLPDTKSRVVFSAGRLMLTSIPGILLSTRLLSTACCIFKLVTEYVLSQANTEDAIDSRPAAQVIYIAFLILIISTFLIV